MINSGTNSRMITGSIIIAVMLVILSCGLISDSTATEYDRSYAELDAVPVDVFKMTNLETLSLQGNHLTVLPSEIGQLTKLRELNFMEI